MCNIQLADIFLSTINTIVKNIIRLILFIGFLATLIFFILFARGFKIDFKQGELIHTGVLEVDSFPQSATIYIDGEMSGFTPHTFRSIDIVNKEVKIEKGNYLSWKNEVQIDDKAVTKVAPLLIPKNINNNIKVIGRAENVFLNQKKHWMVSINNKTKMMHYIDFLSEEEDIIDFDVKFTDVNMKTLLEQLVKPSRHLSLNKNVLFPPSVEERRISNDGSSLLIIRDNTLWKIDTMTKDKILIKAYSEKLEDAFWFPKTEHIIIITSSSIGIIDKSGHEETFLFHKDVEQPVFFMQNTKKLIWRDDKIWKMFSFSHFSK